MSNSPWNVHKKKKKIHISMWITEQLQNDLNT